MEGLQDRLQRVKDRIAETALRCGRRPEEVKLVAVTKTVSADRVRAAVLAGATDFGENYVQEAREKVQALEGEKVNWHFIGRLQTNKAKYAVKLFSLIHTVDSLKLAEELNLRAVGLNKVQPILIQVNVAGETSKAGFEPGRVAEFVTQVARLDHLAVFGLMTMPPFFNAPEKVRPFFAALRELRDEIGRQNIPGVKMQELSMGMSGDFETAIEEGATLVRVGTAIFGRRE